MIATAEHGLRQRDKQLAGGETAAPRLERTSRNDGCVDALDEASAFDDLAWEEEASERGQRGVVSAEVEVG
jgi:hypothetical protein